MKSPFPGMDPYLEAHWRDVHGRLTPDASKAINRSLPPDLVTSIDERIVVESETDEDHGYRPDVQVYDEEGEVAELGEDAGGALVAPYRLLVQVEPAKEKFLKIIEPKTGRLVTVIELISPSNKIGEGLTAFKAKRSELIRSRVNFVEIDLVRQGDWKLLARPHRPGRKLQTAYRVTHRLWSDPHALYFTPISLMDRLPRIAIPLRKGDPRVELDLQSLVDEAYADGRYHMRLDYTKNCAPPLEGEEAAWADQLLRETGKR